MSLELRWISKVLLVVWRLAVLLALIQLVVTQSGFRARLANAREEIARVDERFNSWVILNCPGENFLPVFVEETAKWVQVRCVALDKSIIPAVLTIEAQNQYALPFESFAAVVTFTSDFESHLPQDRSYFVVESIDPGKSVKFDVKLQAVSAHAIEQLVLVINSPK